MQVKPPQIFVPESEPIPIGAGVLAVGVHVVFIGALIVSMSWEHRTFPKASVKLWQTLPVSHVQSTPPPKPARALPPKRREIAKPIAPVEPAVSTLPAPRVEMPRPPAKEAPLPPAELAAPTPPAHIERPAPRSPSNLTAPEPPALPRPMEIAEEPPAPEPEVDVQAMRREKALALAERLRQEENARSNEALERERDARRATLEKRREERERELARKLHEIAAAAERERADQSANEAADAATAAMIDDYRARISAKIRRRVVLPPDLQGNPEAIYEVSLLLGGEVVEVRLRKSSGIATYDSAVERAILAAQPLPVPDDPELFRANFRNFLLSFRPRE